MNDIVVGARIGDQLGIPLGQREGMQPGDVQRPVATRVFWVRIGDRVFDADEIGMTSINHSADNGVHMVTITLMCGRYEVTDADDARGKAGE